MSSDQDFGLALELLDRLFPFHFLIDRDTRVIRAGPSLKTVLPMIGDQPELSQLFAFERPTGTLTYAELKKMERSLLVFRAREQPLVLRGEVLLVGSDALLFAGQPWFTNLSTLETLGLSFADFPTHSPMLEMLNLLQARTVAVNEMQELTNRLQKQKHALRETQSQIEIKLAEAERAKALTQSILDTAVDGIATIDGSGIIQTVNAAFERLFDYPTGELVGRNVNALMPEPDKSQHDEYIRRYLETGEGGVIGQGREVEGTKRDGTRIPIYLSVGEMTAVGEKRFTGIVQDISERKQREQLLKRSEARTRGLIESMLEGVVTLHTNGDIEGLNPAAEKILGYGRDELIGCSILQLMPKDADYEAADFLRRAYKQSIDRATEWRCLTRNGRVIPIELQLYRIDTPTGRLLAAHIRDLSERYEIDRLKKRFISMVSHELRTPLTSLRGSLGLLTSGALGTLSDDVNELLQIGERNTLRLVTLINDILDLERLDVGNITVEPQSTAVQPVLEEAVHSVTALATKQAVSIEIDKTHCTVLGDSDRLVQVVVNLLSNAIKFSPAGAAVQLSAEQQGRMVRVNVRDHGRGVPAEARQLIFEPFRQAEDSDARVKGGSGLGLAISKAIVERHGGEIGVESVQGPGVLFWFSIPATNSSTSTGAGTEG